MIVSFLEGKAKSNLSPENCKAIGIEAAKMHKLTKDFKIKRHNDTHIKIKIIFSNAYPHQHY